MSGQRQVVRLLYASLLRQARGLKGTTLHIAEPVNVNLLSTGRSMRFEPNDILRGMLPTVSELPATTDLTEQQLWEWIRSEFRVAKDAEGKKAEELLDGGLQALRLLSESVSRQECISVCVTRGLRVELVTMCLRKVPARGDYVFGYRLRLANQGTERMKLMGRHWVIRDERQVVLTVPRNSHGVVGMTPTLNPGEAFEYMSYCALQSPRGSIRGSFQMRDERGEPFDAQVGRAVFRAMQ